MSKRARIVVLCAAGAFVLLFPWWMRKPVMLRVWEGPLRGSAKLTLFGPLRDRAPEMAAEKLLGGIRDGRCKEVLSASAATPSQIDEDCQNEAIDPLRKWDLIDRQDTPSLVRLTYYYASPKEPFSSREWLEVQLKHEGGDWRVFTYGRVF
jgi:hypothetical protein